MSATEPPPTAWEFPDPSGAEGDLVAVGADLEPGTILAAYRAGLFPMPVDKRNLGWWSPTPRAILPIEGLLVSRSLRKACRRFEIRVDSSFEAVIDGCADPSRSGRWITPEVRSAYVALHRMGWVHSVEAWSLDDGTLAGGLYGVSVGGLFAGESMFHRVTDASKVALVALVSLLDPSSALLDVQWRTEHLATLGVVEIPRADYLRRLRSILDDPLPEAFVGEGRSPFVVDPAE
ncbi:MAG TPA: leucyl/phenylalanyl-tRNA--protein transferase [Acidimicrobiales bacterium]|nr:leucyl/phenylalanyl-tRNA--protein transferase [Acidimicrobiales bacterium]